MIRAAFEGASAARRYGAAVVATAGLVVLAGCGGSSENGSPTATSAVAPSEVAEVRIGSPSQITTSDPLAVATLVDTRVLHLTAGTLYAFKPGSLETEPVLASGMRTSADGRTVTVTIRPRLTFSDGSPLTANDVASSFARALRNPSTQHDAVFGVIAAVKASDDKVIFTLRQARPRFDQQLAAPTAAITPARAARDAQPPLAGPYKYASSFKGNTVKLVRNDAYAGPRPVAATLTLKVVADSYAQLSQLQGGQLDFVPDVPPDRARGLGGGISSQQVETANTILLTVNNGKAPLDDPAVRRAIGLALDREQLAQIGYAGASKPVTGAIPAVFGGDADATFADAPDLDAAKQALAGTACASGCSFTINSFASDALTGRIATAMQQQLEPLGMKVTSEPIDDATMVNRNFDGSFQTTLALFGGATIGDFMNATLNPDGGLFAAFSYWRRPDAGRLIDAVLSAPEDQLSAALGDLNGAYDADVPWIPVSTAPALTAAREAVAGAVLVSPTGYVDVAAAR